jgi:hypothetical protein
MCSNELTTLENRVQGLPGSLPFIRRYSRNAWATELFKIRDQDNGRSIADFCLTGEKREFEFTSLFL